MLGYTRQAYYDHHKHHVRQQYQEEIILQEVLKQRSLQSKVGTRKLLVMMQEFARGHKIDMGRDRLFTLLREHNLLVRKRKTRARTTFSKHMFRKYKNLIRGFTPQAPNQLWVSDITYIGTVDGFAYLSLVTDAYSRKIMGYCLSQTLEAAGSIQALQMALSDITAKGLIHHSDRGVQYCCNEYVQILKTNGIKISMSENGDPLENAIAERVNGILKMELLDDDYVHFNAAVASVEKSVMIYNKIRLHSSCDMLTPEIAHQRLGPLKKHWKNYYKKKEVITAVPD